MHSQQFTHRNLKPANILVDQESQSDFGIQKESRANKLLFEASGTQDYMAPESFSYGHEADEQRSESTNAVDV